nr:LuxR C-terminal-related transcriptional regulator [bacterium]
MDKALVTSVESPDVVEAGADAEQQRPSPETSLDLSDPIDALLSEFIEEAEADRLPTGSEQRRLVMGVQRGDRECASELVKSHRGFVAAVVFPLKRPDISSKEILLTASQALIDAAQEFNYDGPVDFNDHAIIEVHRSVVALRDGEDSDAPDRLDKPMERLLCEAGEAPAAFRSRSAYRQELERRYTELGRLTPSQLEILPTLHLSSHAAAEQTKKSVRGVMQLRTQAAGRLGLHNRIELALWAADQGVPFELKKRPPLDRFTIRERQVATRLSQEDREIAKDLELSVRQVRLSLASLQEKMAVESRIEVALMAREGFEPRPEELVDDTPEALRIFTPKQREVLELIHLPLAEIAEQLERPVNA